MSHLLEPNERRLLAACLLALLASGLWYMWEDGGSGGGVTGTSGGNKEEPGPEDEPLPTKPPDDSTTEHKQEEEEHPVKRDKEDGGATVEQQTELNRETTNTTGEPLTPPGGNEEPTNTTDKPPTTPLVPNTDQNNETENNFDSLYHNICPPESAHQPLNNSNTLNSTTNTVFIVNGLSALGGRIAYALAGDQEQQVLNIASSQDRLCADPLLLFRQDVLREKGVRTLFIDWSDVSSLAVLFEENQPRHVIVVPPSAGGEGSGFDLDASMWAAALHNFLNLLETVRSVSPDTRLTLVSVSKSVKNELETVEPKKGTVSLLETLVGAFELSLSTYHTLYKIPFSVLRVRGFYGPWTHESLLTINARPVGCFIDDVVQFVYSSLSFDYNCIVLDFSLCDSKSSRAVEYAVDKVSVTRLTVPAMAVAMTNQWRTQYNMKSQYKTRKMTRLVLTSYFTGRGFNAAPDRSKRLLKWAESIKNLKLEAVVLHDGLGAKFLSHVHNRYPNLHFKFVYLPFDYGMNSNCRESVIAFAEYLEKHADIGSVLVVDLHRRIKRNVFPLMKAMGDWLYTDLDIIPFWDALLNNTTNSNESFSQSDSIVLGGSRHLVLATLHKMAMCLQENKNQSTAPVLNCLTDRHFVEHAHTGWPLSNAII